MDQWQPVELYHVAWGIAMDGARGARRLDASRVARQDVQEAVVEKRYRLRVFGPLPGRPDQLGEFVLIATSCGSNRDRWWNKPEAPPGN